MQYRALNIDDYPKLLQLWQAAQGVKLREADSEQGIAKYLARNPGLSFVAEDGGKIVGSIMAGHDGKRGYIQHLAVLTERQKAGIATKLLALCLDALKAEGILKSHIHVLGDNALAKEYWSNRGWVRRSDIEVYSYINGAGENT
ncbi:GNAT family N-acetyltransferase [Gallaecimonas mangrovi]|uniref:GNAT family N-acetyltransferase n=1 Tax=Gallaecimonas mangrovi TaxID=2291597 RepID=UPI000E202374|nr:GNAT family N-acetyltransferase [Gallaecimonas mangrovi]